MKCPNCGSTAQVKNIFLNTKDEVKKTNKYICGCGCVFSVNKQK